MMGWRGQHNSCRGARKIDRVERASLIQVFRIRDILVRIRILRSVQTDPDPALDIALFVNDLQEIFFSLFLYAFSIGRYIYIILQIDKKS
jgi:hypothetical protein